MPRLRSLLLSLAVVLGVGWPRPLLAATPHLLQLQGRLEDASGAAMTGVETLTVGIFDAETVAEDPVVVSHAGFDNQAGDDLVEAITALGAFPPPTKVLPGAWHLRHRARVPDPARRGRPGGLRAQAVGDPVPHPQRRPEPRR